MKNELLILVNPVVYVIHVFLLGQIEILDVIEMDAASKTGVDDIREIIDNIKYKPVGSKNIKYLLLMKFICSQKVLLMHF